jgi:hypothetical protein
MNTRPYDIGTLIHWLQWELRCADASGEDFQKLFEAVIKRVDSRFMAIRPYGNIGDRKCDGLFYEDKVVFQVYSPDELTQANTQTKIEEDLEGAVKHWKKRGLKEWVFVYNTRRGLPPDIPATLDTQKKQYPWLTITHMSKDELWKKLAALPPQSRAEVLGPIIGYEHVPFLDGGVDPETIDRLKRGRFVLIHDAMVPIDRHAAAEAIPPDVSLGPPLTIRPRYGDGAWGLAAEFQEQLVDDAVARSADLRPRFAVFSLSPIPLVIHLGYRLSDRVEVQPFQFDRDRKSWRWSDGPVSASDLDVRVNGLPETEIAGRGDVIIRVSLSDRINPRDTHIHVPNALAEIDISVPDADRMWLRSEQQLVRLATEFRRALKLIGQRVPNVERIHLFAAAPTPACIVMGQAINPRMTPPVALYEFNWQRSPKYEHVLTLSTAGAVEPARSAAMPGAGADV